MAAWPPGAGWLLLLLGRALAAGDVASETYTLGGDTTQLAVKQATSLVQTLGPQQVHPVLAQEETALSAGVQDLLSATARMADSRHSGADMTGVAKQVDVLADLMKTWTAIDASTANGTHLSGIDRHQLQRIKDAMNTTLFGNLWNFSSEDQAEVDSDHSALVHCDTTRQDALNGTLASALSALGSAREDHKNCRSSESAAVTTRELAQADLDGLETSTPEPPACPHFAHVSQYFDPQLSAMKRWYDEHGPVFASKTQALTTATRAAHDKKAGCDGQQRLLEQHYCSYAEQLRSTCSTYDACHGKSLPKYQATVQRVRQNVDDRKALYKSGLAVMCHLDVILGEDPSKSHDECAGLLAGHNDSSLDINYPVAPGRSTCDTSGFSRSPCDAEWIADEFAWMPDNVRAVACSRCSWETPAPTPTTTPAPSQSPVPAPTPGL